MGTTNILNNIGLIKKLKSYVSDGGNNVRMILHII